ncbi:hypothetical protein N136_02615 [Leifsonia aquatica ATCC 14665]|uniref:Uncharacterized protein n=1 Tax=Leifsonia aquatica ATCC 14665 TaxID=1358026 RepID=U2RQC6_LEIAQ|nr:hypothetical protein N136_02615 [Leifsonia aquatica ATCC 14665]
MDGPAGGVMQVVSAAALDLRVQRLDRVPSVRVKVLPLLSAVRECLCLATEVRGVERGAVLRADRVTESGRNEVLGVDRWTALLGCLLGEFSQWAGDSGSVPQCGTGQHDLAIRLCLSLVQFICREFHLPVPEGRLVDLAIVVLLRRVQVRGGSAGAVCPAFEVSCTVGTAGRLQAIRSVVRRWREAEHEGRLVKSLCQAVCPVLLISVCHAGGEPQSQTVRHERYRFFGDLHVGKAHRRGDDDPGKWSMLRAGGVDADSEVAFPSPGERCVSRTLRWSEVRLLLLVVGPFPTSHVVPGEDVDNSWRKLTRITDLLCSVTLA